MDEYLKELEEEEKLKSEIKEKLNVLIGEYKDKDPLELLETISESLTELTMETADNSIDSDNLYDKTMQLLEYANNYHDCIISDDDKNSPEEIITDFVDDYMAVNRCENIPYSHILEAMEQYYEDEDLYDYDGELMTAEKYNSIINYIYEDAKQGMAGFKWDW